MMIACQIGQSCREQPQQARPWALQRRRTPALHPVPWALQARVRVLPILRFLRRPFRQKQLAPPVRTTAQSETWAVGQREMEPWTSTRVQLQLQHPQYLQRATRML